MKTILKYLPSIIFNVAETAVIALVGMLLHLEFKYMILIFVVFAMVRMKSGKAMHYKAWYKCLVWSTLVFLSLFVVAKVDIIICIIMTIFCAYILTNKADVRDIFEWKGNDSKYEALRDFIAMSPNNPILLEHEEYWRKNYLMRYKILQSFYRERKSHNKIMEEEGLSDNSIIKSECKTIYAILEKPLGLPPIK